MVQRLIILSGGIGSGKSAVGRLLAERGATVVHADAIGHEVLEPEGSAFGDVASRWPEVVADGRIDRRALGRIVFNDPAQLAELESMTHPAIRRRIRSIVDRSDAWLVVVELPLLADLLGPGWTRVVVDAPEDVRRARLLDRGMEADEIDARMGAQPSAEAWRAAGAYVIENVGDPADLDRRVDAFVRWLELVPVEEGASE